MFKADVSEAPRLLLFSRTECYLSGAETLSQCLARGTHLTLTAARGVQGEAHGDVPGSSAEVAGQDEDDEEGEADSDADGGEAAAGPT